MNTTSDMKKTYGGSKDCTNDNLIYFATKLKEINDTNTKMTFRKWINTMMNLLDLIDQLIAPICIKLIARRQINVNYDEYGYTC